MSSRSSLALVGSNPLSQEPKRRTDPSGRCVVRMGVTGGALNHSLRPESASAQGLVRVQGMHHSNLCDKGIEGGGGAVHPSREPVTPLGFTLDSASGAWRRGWDSNPQGSVAATPMNSGLMGPRKEFDVAAPSSGGPIPLIARIRSLPPLPPGGAHAPPRPPCPCGFKSPPKIKTPHRPFGPTRRLGGGGGIRTHKGLAAQRFSRPPG